MGMGYTTCGGKHLAKKSALAGVQAKLDLQREILVIDSQVSDCERLCATLRVVFGYETQIACASALLEAVERIKLQRPGLVFLSDPLPPATDAIEAIPQLRTAGFDGPVIVVSTHVTHATRAFLLAAGASDVIHKDEIDSVRVAEALLSLVNERRAKAAAPQPNQR